MLALGRLESRAFQVGKTRFDPLARVITEDAELDYAVLDVDDLSVNGFSIAEEVGGDIHEPVRWPPLPVDAGNFIGTAGFPGLVGLQLTRNASGRNPASVKLIVQPLGDADA